jgi:pSer/pThr/pTyr-binding forkhead associated (FHA) protein
MSVKILVVHGKPAGKSLVFPAGDHYLGRGPECQVRFNSDWVSRQHCLLRVTAEGVSLRDLGSRNGTLVNGQLLSGECALKEGDQVQIGPVVFEVRLEAPTPPASAQPTVRPIESEETQGDPPVGSTAHHPTLAPPHV